MRSWHRLHRGVRLPAFLAFALLALTLSATYSSLAVLRSIHDLEQRLIREAPLILRATSTSPGGVKFTRTQLEDVARKSPSVRAFAPVASELLWVAAAPPDPAPAGPGREPPGPEKAVQAVVEWTTPAYLPAVHLELRYGMPLPEGTAGVAGRAVLLSCSFGRRLFGSLPPEKWLGRSLVFSRGTPNVAAHITYRGSSSVPAYPAPPVSTELFTAADLRQRYQVVGVFQGSELARLVGAEPQVLAPLGLYLDTAGRQVAPSLFLYAQAAPGRREDAARELQLFGDLALRQAGGRVGNAGQSDSPWARAGPDPRYGAALDILHEQAVQIRLRLLLSVIVATVGSVAVVWTLWGGRVQELGLRRSLGAGRAMLLYQGVAESIRLGWAALLPGVATGEVLRRLLMEAVVFSLSASGTSAALPGAGSAGRGIATIPPETMELARHLLTSQVIGETGLGWRSVVVFLGALGGSAVVTFSLLCLVTLASIWVATREAPARALQEGRPLE